VLTSFLHGHWDAEQLPACRCSRRYMGTGTLSSCLHGAQVLMSLHGHRDAEQSFLHGDRAGAHLSRCLHGAQVLTSLHGHRDVR
jgi:hypothetical protein